MLIQQRNARWWNALNGLSRHAILNGAVPGTFHPLINEFPKSGGSWLAQMVAAALDLPNPRRRLPMLRSSMMHGHYLRPRRMRDVVIVTRDGRDVAVSFYYHMIADNDFAGTVARDQARAALGAVDYNDIRANLPRFIELLATGKVRPWFGWSTFHDAWAGVPSVRAQVRYEDMLSDPAAELERVLAALGRPASRDACIAVADRFRFRKQAARDPGVEDKRSYLRKGVAGDWRNHFTAEAAAMFDRFEGKTLVALGYERDRSWVADVRDPEPESVTPAAHDANRA